MFSVGVRCVSQVPSTREANSYFFEEEMASTFGEEKSVDTHLFQLLVSISLHSTFASNIATMHVRSPDSVNISCSEQQYVSTDNRVKTALRACSGTIQDAYVLS